MITARVPGGRARANAVTVDVEEWFHVCAAGPHLAPDRWPTLPSRVVLTTRLLLEDLDRAGARATFFVLGWVAERHPHLVSEIQSAGHDIGSHGHMHARVYELGPDAFADDLVLAAADGEISPITPDEAMGEARALFAFMDGIEIQWLLDPTVDMVGEFDRYLARTLARLGAVVPDQPA